MEYKEGMWVSFKSTVGSYGVIVAVWKDRIFVRWMDIYYTEEDDMEYFINPANDYVDSVKMILVLPPVIAAFYEDG